MAGATCTRCGAEADVMISSVEGATPVSRPYCDACWRVARYEAGPIMSEGPITWGADWPEVEEWLARNRRSVNERPDSALWHRVFAHDLKRQLRHLPPDVPPRVAAFLREFGNGAG